MSSRSLLGLPPELEAELIEYIDNARSIPIDRKKQSIVHLLTERETLIVADGMQEYGCTKEQFVLGVLDLVIAHPEFDPWRPDDDR